MDGPVAATSSQCSGRSVPLLSARESASAVLADETCETGNRVREIVISEVKDFKFQQRVDTGVLHCSHLRQAEQVLAYETPRGFFREHVQLLLFSVAQRKEHDVCNTGGGGVLYVT